MKSLIIVYFLAFFATELTFTQNENLSNTSELTNISTDIYSKCGDAIVKINNYDQNNALQGYGSGVIVSESGIIYTNYHVVENAFRIEVRKGNDKYDSIPFVGFDPFNDAAILKLPGGSYPYINISKDKENKIGDIIYTLGNPQGYTNTLSVGIISSFRSNTYQNQIQFTAPISGGSSGGALLNSNGGLIGITSHCVTTGQNMNFAIPIAAFENIPIIDLDNSENSFLLKQMLAFYNPSLNSSGSISFDSTVMVISRYCDMYKIDSSKWMFAGQLYSKLGKYDSAIACFSRGIELNNMNKYLYKYRADCYAQISDTNKALGDYESALNICNTYLDLYIDRAKYFQYTLKDYKKAIDDYNMVLNLNPEYDFVYTEMANCRISLNDKIGAIKELSNSLLWKNDNYELYILRAKIYTSLNLYWDAIKDYTTALYLSAFPNTDCYYSRAILYSKINEPVNAISDYQEYIKYYTNDPAAYNNLAYTYMSINENDLAEYNFNKAIKIDKKHFDSYLGLSILKYREGKIKSSIQNMCKAIEIQDMLMFGMPGIEEMEKSSWFWDKEEKKDMKKILKLMGITDRKVEQNESKTSKHRGVKSRASEINNK
ncbi:MAG: trypsin-like peptidase domain-containing protein [Ignavibacteria bacterium]|nr:trypsin-like peptidase domain-containing protein [Ignavibacteria bacterium]